MVGAHLAAIHRILSAHALFNKRMPGFALYRAAA